MVVGAVPNDQENDITLPVVDDSDNDNDNDNTRSIRKSVQRLRKKIISWSGNENELNAKKKKNNNNEASAASAVSAAAALSSASALSTSPTMAIVDEAFGPLEDSLKELEDSLVTARAAFSKAKLQSFQAMEAMEAVASSSSSRVEKEVAAFDDIYTNLDALTFEDIDYESSEMAPPFLDQDSCLMTDAEPLVRVEKAPDNSRRIFAGIDILASTEDVWKVRHTNIVLSKQDISEKATTITIIAETAVFRSKAEPCSR